MLMSVTKIMGKLEEKKIKPRLGLKIDITGDKPVSMRLCMYMYLYIIV